MKSYIEYFEPGGNVRYIKRYVTEKPDGKEEFPNTTYSSYLTWLLSKWINKKNEAKEVNVETPKDNAITSSNTGGKYVVNFYNPTPNTSDTIRTGNRVIIVNHKLQS